MVPAAEPSYFGSYSQPLPSGRSSTGSASIGFVAERDRQRHSSSGRLREIIAGGTMLADPANAPGVLPEWAEGADRRGRTHRAGNQAQESPATMMLR